MPYFKKYTRHLNGKQVTSKTKLAMDHMKANPDCSISDAAKLFDLDEKHLIGWLQRQNYHGRHCPICCQKLMKSEPLANVNRYLSEYQDLLSRVMDAVRQHGSLSNEEILDMVHSHDSGSTPCHSTQSQQD